MSRVTRRAARAVGIAALLGLPGRAYAQAPAPPGSPVAPEAAPPVPAPEHAVRLVYTAHQGCPDAAAFYLAVRARTQRVRVAAPGEPAEAAVVVITQSSTGSVGTLELPPLDGHPFTRRVEANSCQEVVLALSLVLALAYDPDAITTFPSTVTAPPSAPVPVAPVAPYPSSAPPEPPTAPPPEPTFGAAAGVTVLGTTGVAPGLRPVIGPFIEYGSTSKNPFRFRGMVSLFVEVPEASVRPTIGGPASATLRYFGGQITGCPLWAPLLPDVTLAPCLAFDLGQILGTGEGVNGVTDSLLWAAFEAIVRLRANLPGPLFTEVVGSGGITLQQSKFVFQNAGNLPVFKIPVGFGSFGLGLGVHFP